MSNAYTILEDVRMALNEYSEEYVNGDEEGAYSNTYLMRKINNAQRYIYSILLDRIPGDFLTSTDLTGVDSVYTLPSDFGKVHYFIDDDGDHVYPMRVDQKRLVDGIGSENLYYRMGNTLVVDAAGLTTTYTLWYYKRPRDLDVGTCVSGGALAIQLDITADKTEDYYNNMYIYDKEQDFTTEITDYSAGRVCTISETAATGDHYGIVPDLPEMFHQFIAIKAVLDINLEHPIAMKQPVKYSFEEFNNQLNDALTAFVGSNDYDIDDVFCDFTPHTG